MCNKNAICAVVPTCYKSVYFSHFFLSICLHFVTFTLIATVNFSVVRHFLPFSFLSLLLREKLFFDNNINAFKWPHSGLHVGVRCNRQRLIMCCVNFVRIPNRSFECRHWVPKHLLKMRKRIFTFPRSFCPSIRFSHEKYSTCRYVVPFFS